jgi:hypothetical protein
LAARGAPEQAASMNAGNKTMGAKIDFIETSAADCRRGP